jgi:hypothetical protein
MGAEDDGGELARLRDRIRELECEVMRLQARARRLMADQLMGAQLAAYLERRDREDAAAEARAADYAAAAEPPRLPAPLPALPAEDAAGRARRAPRPRARPRPPRAR